MENMEQLWNIPTYILYGEKDNMTSYETILNFANKTKANLTIMKGGEHWFHTDQQMEFLDNWIKNLVKKINCYKSIEM